MLHQDINLGGILIGQNGKALLIDWELSKHEAAENKPSGRKWRTVRIDMILSNDSNTNHKSTLQGTWKFMSIALLVSNRKVHEVRDDLESFLWLLYYMLLRFTESNLSCMNLKDEMAQIFDAYVLQDDGQQATGGRGKRSEITEIADSKRTFDVAPCLQSLLEEYAGLFTSIYIFNEKSTESLNKHMAALDRLKKHDSVVELFKTALSTDGWSNGGAIEDQIEVGQGSNKRHATKRKRQKKEKTGALPNPKTHTASGHPPTRRSPRIQAAEKSKQSRAANQSAQSKRAGPSRKA
jgi:hypothetical protein